jgi:hypothetical protein
MEAARRNPITDERLLISLLLAALEVVFRYPSPAATLFALLRQPIAHRALDKPRSGLPQGATMGQLSAAEVEGLKLALAGFEHVGAPAMRGRCGLRVRRVETWMCRRWRLTRDHTVGVS